MNMWRIAGVVCVASIGAALGGCGGQDSSGPPEIQYGVSVCADCNMIISDERFASAAIVRGERGAEALLFDDIGDQIRYERERPELEIIARWTHDYATRAWIRAEDATFVHSPDLPTPMASGLAAFEERDAANRLLEEVGGETLTFEELWARE